MEKEITLQDLKIEKATPKDWKSILDLMNKTDLAFWFTGNESHDNFFVVKDNMKGGIICAFAIEHENKCGILKSFATKIELQGKGIGKYIVNSKITDLIKSLGISRLYAASIEAPGFWQKTIFKEVKLEDIEDKYFLQYLNKFKDIVPNYYEQTHYFFLEI
jgi:N-acetylglutamate synthase-like GNAT family acetyltransferase